MLRPSFLLPAPALGATALGESHPPGLAWRVPARGNKIPPLKDAPGFWGGFPAALWFPPPTPSRKAGEL